MKEIDARCRCTMQEMGEDRWIKPFDGYFDPDPNCPECEGKGTKKAKFNFGETAEATYVGICPVCGERNGIYFVYPETGHPSEEDELPRCLNEDCGNEFVNWVNIDDMEED